MSVNDQTVVPVAISALLSRAAVMVTRCLLGAVLIGMVLLNVANAVGRYAFGAVFIGADEVLVFGMVWMVMLGMLLVTAEGSHISLDLLPTRAGVRAKIILSLIAHSVMALGCAYAAVQSFFFVQRIMSLGQTSMALGLPMMIPHSALIVGFGGTAVIALAMVAGDLARLVHLAADARGRG
jgi:TRAP-type C4-dicarboxylate transport system permease small subunit